jgi:hypothetical protein
MRESGQDREINWMSNSVCQRYLIVTTLLADGLHMSQFLCSVDSEEKNLDFSSKFEWRKSRVHSEPIILYDIKDA